MPADITPTNTVDYIASRLREGYVVPFLGAGASLAGQNRREFELGDNLPSGWQLAQHLLDSQRLDTGADTELELPLAAEWCNVKRGLNPVYGELRKVFLNDFPVGPVHRYLADVLKDYQKDKSCDREIVIITTNYDNLMEKALQSAGVGFHVITYLADGLKTGNNFDPKSRGKCVHIFPNGTHQIIEDAGDYKKLNPDPNSDPVILVKVHGSIFDSDGKAGTALSQPQNNDHSKSIESWESYVITESHYLDYFSHSIAEILFPAPIPSILGENHLLFLGYGLSDWNLRLMLTRIWKNQQLDATQWSVNLKVEPHEEDVWQARGVEVFQEDLVGFVDRLRNTPTD